MRYRILGIKHEHAEARQAQRITTKRNRNGTAGSGPHDKGTQTGQKEGQSQTDATAEACAETKNPWLKGERYGDEQLAAITAMMELMHLKMPTELPALYSRHSGQEA